MKDSPANAKSSKKEVRTDESQSVSGEERAPRGEAESDQGGGGAGRDPDDPSGAGSHAAAEKADEALRAAQNELSELNDRHLRLAAEFNNFRRRSEQERLESWSRAQADLLARFLDVLDDLQRVAQLDLSTASVEGIMEGIDLVERKFARVLSDAGVEVIDPDGAAFDPERMEAVMRVPADDPKHDDHVAQVFQKGYALKGQLVRPARVSVYKAD